MWWLSTSFMPGIWEPHATPGSQDSQIFSVRLGAGLPGHCCSRHLQNLAWGLMVSWYWAGGGKSWSMCELVLSVVVLFNVNVKLNNTKPMTVSIHHLCNLCTRQFSWAVTCQQWCVLSCHISTHVNCANKFGWRQRKGKVQWFLSNRYWNCSTPEVQLMRLPPQSCHICKSHWSLFRPSYR